MLSSKLACVLAAAMLPCIVLGNPGNMVTSSGCSRSAKAGATIMGQTVTDSSAATARLYRGDTSLDCGSNVTEGESLTFKFSGASPNQWLFEVSVEDGSGTQADLTADQVLGSSECTGVNRIAGGTDKAVTVPSSGSAMGHMLTARVTWGTSNSAPVMTNACSYKIVAGSGSGMMTTTAAPSGAARTSSVSYLVAAVLPLLSLAFLRN